MIVKGRKEQLSSTLVIDEQSVDVTNAIKIPLDYLQAFGSFLLCFVRSATSINIPTLLTVTDKLRVLWTGVQTLKMDQVLGSFRDAATGFGQARFHVQQGMSLTSVTTMPL